jgi:predicted AAA+ superfamily ATPase
VISGNAFENAVKNDLAQLQILAGIRSEWIKDAILHLCRDDEAIREAVMKLPPWISENPSWQQKASDPDGAVAPDRVREIKELLLKSDSWPDCTEDLAEFHRSCGSGIFSKYRAFVWRRIPALAIAGGYNIPGIDPACDQAGYYQVPGNIPVHQGSVSCPDSDCAQAAGTVGEFIGVESPDPVRFSDLISYDLEREEVIQNTLHFLDGRPANNILLYGDRGTGKSSTVKALANEYHDRGLRIIEVPKGLLADFPLIIRRLDGRNLKFILFVDDLSFEDNEENYTSLKAILEGGLEIKPDNVLIYATSNRKHLIKERFSERAGLASGSVDDEIRAADTIQEKLSLSDRFGITVVFSSPDKKTYLEIVEGMAKKRGLKIDREHLHREAMKWELQYSGRSPRTARQFVDWLEANI